MAPTLVDILSLDLPAFVIGIGFHEFCHAWSADRLGDPTPREQGRVSLNPFRHLSLVGTILPISLAASGFQVQFGWGKPVTINRENLRDPRRHFGLVAMAGPAGNLLLVLMFGLFLRWSWEVPALLKSFSRPDVNFLFRLMFRIYAMNLGLFLFNLLPVPPLDGSKILMSVGGKPVEALMKSIAPFSLMIFIFLIMSGVDKTVFGPLFIRCTQFIAGEMAPYVLSPSMFIADFR